MSETPRGVAERVSAGEALAGGLSPLDQERAESMASEGGRSAQARESLPLAEPSLMPTGRRWRWWLALSLGAVAGYLGYRGLRRDR